MCSYVANLDKRTLAFRRPERSTVFSHNSSSFNLDGTTAGATIANINDDSLPPPEDGEESGMNFVSRWLNRRKVFARDNPRTVEVQIQALHYLGVFFVTHIWSTTNRIMQQTRGKTIFGVILVHSIFDPLQGFLNFCVYQRTRYLRLRKRNNMSRCSAAMLALRFSFLPKMDIEQSPGGTSSTRSKNESEQSLTMSRFSNTFSDGRALQSIQEVSESELSVVASESSTSLPHAPSSDLRPQGIHEEKDGASEEVTESRMLPSLESSIYDDSDKDSVDDLLEAASRRLVGRAQAHS